MTTRDVAAYLMDLVDADLERGDDALDPDFAGSVVQRFDRAGVMTTDEGFVLVGPGGATEFQITVVRTR